MEVNIVKKNIGRVKARIAYVYPSLYRVMISGLSADFVYQMLNAIEEVFVERFVCSKLYGTEKDPRSLETGSPLRDFKLILTTLHYEPDVVNLARLLVASGVEVLSKNRESHVVIAGGPACIENPIPYGGLVDACILGEAESVLPRIVELWLEYGEDKKVFLEALSQLKYVYVHGFEFDRLERSYVTSLDTAFYPTRQIENTDIEPIYGRGLKVEVSRGCPFWCSFCIETRAFNPYRERSYTNLVKIVEEGVEYSISGRRVVLFSLAFPISNTNKAFLEYLVREGFKASLPSVRMSPMLEKTLDLIKATGQKTLTLAPESFSPYIHRALFKYVGLENYIVELIRKVLEQGFNVKLYLIYGIKGLDKHLVIDENARVIRELAKYARSLGRKLSVTLNPLVPKPQTIFQYIGMSSREELMQALREYKSRLKGLAECRPYDVDWAIIQAHIALSTTPLGDFIARWALHGGGLSGWRRAVREQGINIKHVFNGYSTESELPWSRIVLGEKVNDVLLSQLEAYKKLLISS